jgi:two-component system, OmpR family, phosphate regulon sensor histidine kinase PhoR
MAQDRTMTMDVGSAALASPRSVWDTRAVAHDTRSGIKAGGGEFPATLLAMAGHDLRQPLQLITSAHDVLGQILHSDEQREELARAEDATAQLASMLGQLVEALQVHELAPSEPGEPVQLRPVLDELALEFAEPARLKGVTLTVARGRFGVFSHPVLLGGILRNLLRNALDYTPRGGRVFVACRRCGADVRIEVRDTGAGIRAEALPRIFRAFERADETGVDGLGLGLFIVKRAAELLGHRLEVRSEVGRGSCFAVVARAADLPLKPVSRVSSLNGISWSGEACAIRRHVLNPA